MDYDARRELHRELVYRLKRELTFYRSLYVLVVRQRDAALEGDEAKIALSYGELDTIIGGLRESQFAVSTIREKEPRLFEAAARMSPVPEIVAEASEILAAAHKLIQESTHAARRHYRRLQAELAKLSRERKALHAYKPSPGSGRILDGTR
jgi:hypothetical protein